MIDKRAQDNKIEGPIAGPNAFELSREAMQSPNPQEQALSALAEACEQNSIKSSAELVRKGNNFLFRLEEAELAGRVSKPSEGSVERIQRELEFLFKLEEQSVPAVRPVGPCIHTGAGDVTFFHWENHRPEDKIDYREMGEVLKALHAASESVSLDLPKWDFFSTVERRLVEFEALFGDSSQELELLKKECQRLKEEFSSLEANGELEFRPIHGDFYEGNILNTPTGLVICDFERICIGPKEWDLIPTSVRWKRFGMSEEDFSYFLEGYGSDIRQWQHFELFTQMRELRMITFLFQNVSASEAHQAELQKRLSSFSAGRSSDNWSAL